MSKKMRFERAQIGEKRYIKQFALFPIRIGSETRWLERVYIEQCTGHNCFYDIVWKNARFLSYSEYCMLKFGENLVKVLEKGI